MIGARIDDIYIPQIIIGIAFYMNSRFLGF